MQPVPKIALLAALTVMAPIALLVTTVTTVPAAAGPKAQIVAAAAWGSPCTAGELCVASGLNGTGTIGSFRCCAPDLAQFGLNNNISSYWNRSGSQWCLYDLKNYGGPILATGPGNPGPSNLGSFENDRASSLSRNFCP